MPSLFVNGVNLYYELHGPEGAPVVALLNGVLMHTASWALQTPSLARRYRVLLHDARNQGASDHPLGPCTMALHAQDLAALLHALGIPRAHVAGISYGGELAQRFALDHPEMVHSLFISSAVSEVRPLLEARIRGWMEAARRRDGELLYRCSVADTFSEAWLAAHPEWEAAALPRYRELDFDAVLRLCQAFLDIDWTAELRRISAPTLVVVGELDALKPLDPYSRILAREIPGAHLLVLGGAGHACCLETPHAWNAALLGWLATHQG